MRRLTHFPLTALFSLRIFVTSTVCTTSLTAVEPVPDSSTKIKTLPGSYCSLVRKGDDIYALSEQVKNGSANASNKVCPGINLYSVSGNGLTDRASVCGPDGVVG